MLILEKVTRKNESNSSVIRGKSLVKDNLKDLTPKSKVLLLSAPHHNGTVSKFLLDNAGNNILPRNRRSARMIVKHPVKDVMTFSKHGFKVVRTNKSRNRKRDP